MRGSEMLMATVSIAMIMRASSGQDPKNVCKGRRIATSWS